MKNITLFLAFCQMYFTVLGQQKEYNFVNFSSKDGLAANNVNAIHKDKFGFMWFGTEGGLNRFDGQKFVVYQHRESDTTSIGRGGVMAIAEDRNGNLWIGTNFTLSYYNRGFDNFINFDFRQIGWIRSLCTDYLGNVWVGTYTGLFYFNSKTKKIKTYKANPNDYRQLKSELILSIFEDSRKNIWVGTKNGLHLFNPKTQTFQRFNKNETSLNSISDDVIRSITEDKSGDLWIGTDAGGLNRFSIKRKTFKTYRCYPTDENTLSSNRIYKIVFDTDQKLWIGTDAGVNIFDTNTEKAYRIKTSQPSRYSIFSGFVGTSVRDIYIDKGGIYWFSSYQSGVNKYDKNLTYFNYKFHNPYDNRGLNASSVTTFAETSDHKICIGTNAGLNIFDPQTNSVSSFQIRGASGPVYDVISMQTVGNKVWVGTYQNGLFDLNSQTKTAKQLNILRDEKTNTFYPINCILGDKNGNLWLGTNGFGTFFYNTTTSELIPLKKIIRAELIKNFTINDFVNTLIEDNSGNIWIGSNGSGIAIFNPIRRDFKILNHDNSKLPIDKVQNMLQDSKGNIWVGIFGGGLSLFDKKSQTFIQYSEEQLLSNNVVYKILEDNAGKIWVSTNKGISVFDSNRKSFKNYTSQNGIQQSTFNIGAGLKTNTGEIYFGGLEGFNFFNPKYLFQNKNIPALIITDLKINNKRTYPEEDAEISEPIATAQEINLSYRQNFSLDFVALNYTSPHENQYSYILEGFDKDWTHSSTTSANYTNLDPGTYTFRLKASSEDGSWQTPERAIKIFVHPPFWRTNFAYFLYFAIIAGTVWGIRRRGIQKLRQEFALEQERLEVKFLIENERQEAERKMELEQLKIKFLTNLSHELKTPLTLILNPIEGLLDEEKNSEKSEILNIIHRNAKRLLNLVNQLLDLRKIQENELNLNLSESDFISFAKEIFDSFKFLSERKHISLDFDSSIIEYHTTFDKDKIERVLVNLLSNAIKFTNENGHVYFQIETDSNKGLKLIIADSGIGIPEELKTQIFERFFQINNPSNILNQGSGIGLSIANEFVKLHGGAIQVESEENMGSTFIILLPFVRTDKTISQIPYISEIEKVSIATEIDKRDVEKNKKPVVLIVEDSEDLRLYLHESLKAKYKIIEATDGKQGWQKALATHPEVIISDINMPNMNGIALVRKLKNDARTKHIPVILLTVLSEEIEQLKGLETGANDYLTKPFNLNLLNLKINNLLSLNTTFKETYSKQIVLNVPDAEVVSEDEKFMIKIGKYIEEHITDPELSIEELSQKMFMSRGTLYNKILSLTNETPVEYVRSIRLKKAISLLEKSDMKISQIAYEVGFSNPNYFARAFKAKYGISPTEYIQKVKI